MNITGNVRFQSTEDQIEKAVLNLLKRKKYDDFTIKDICAEAGINRSSFYAHYQDINDLMIKIERRIAKKVHDILKPIQDFTKDGFTENPFITFFKFLQENKIFYKAFLKSNMPSFVAPEAMKRQRDAFKQLSVKNNYNYSEGEIDYHQYFFGGGLKAICEQWLLHDCRETPEQMAKIIYDEYTNNARYTK